MMGKDKGAAYVAYTNQWLKPPRRAFLQRQNGRYAAPGVFLRRGWGSVGGWS
jgi:hypothetical protein